MGPDASLDRKGGNAVLYCPNWFGASMAVYPRQTGVSSPQRAVHPASTEEPAPPEVLQQLERILDDRLFQSSQRLSAFLRFAVEHALAGRAEELKEYVIGVEVFEGGDAFN